MPSLELCVKLKMISYDVVFIAPKNLHNIVKQHVLPHFSPNLPIFSISLTFCSSAVICPNVSRPQSRRLVVFTKFKIIIFILALAFETSFLSCLTSKYVKYYLSSLTGSMDIRVVLKKFGKINF